MNEDAASPDFVKSLAKGMAILEILNEEMKPVTLTEVASLSGITRAAARRFLLTFEELGYLKSQDRRFCLTPKILSLSSAFLSSTSLSSLATPFLQHVTDVTGESSSLTVLDGNYIVYIARVTTSKIMSANIHVGTRLTALYTSMGRAMVANLTEHQIGEIVQQSYLESLTPQTVTNKKELKKILSDIKKQGYALVNQELEIGLLSLAVPVYDKEGTPVAAINIACSAGINTPEKLIEEFLPELLNAANDLQQLIR